MDHQKYLEWTYFGRDALDADEFERFGVLLEDVDVFIDVGASHGVYTSHALQHMSAGRILAIEADPERFEILERNVERWRTGDTHVSVECMLAAASDDRDIGSGGTVTFFVTGTQISGGLFPVQERSDEYSPIEIPLVKIDDLVKPGEKALIKIDVEGGELRVLRGAEQVIRSGRGRFFVELSWWGDRERHTSVLTTLRFAWKQDLGIEKRLRSDYLLYPEPNGRRRAVAILRVLPHLLPRYVFSTVVPARLRTAYIRRQNERRLARAPQPTTLEHVAHTDPEAET